MHEVSELGWFDVDPRTHAFEEAEARAVVSAALHRDRSEEAVTRALRERFGAWASGWRWASGEGSIGGGPVRAWCCPPHSIGRRTPEETIRLASDAIVEWRAWIDAYAKAGRERYGLAEDTEARFRACLRGR
jgi:hypothetical protein